MRQATQPASNASDFDLDAPPTPIVQMPHLKRDIAEVDPRLLARIRAVCAGERPWPLTMLGGVGVGKTLAALCVLDRVRAARCYVTCADLVKRITDSRRDSEGLGVERKFWEHWRTSALVVLDEIGARDRVSDAHYEIVKMAIDHRAGRPAIYISNLPIETLTAIYDARIVSRLQEGTAVEMFGETWADRRKG